MAIKFEVGKKYKHLTSLGTRNIATCIAFTSRDQAILEWDHSGVVNAITIPDHWEEYVEPKRGTVWVNIYKMNSSPAYNDRAMADRYALEGRLACIEVPWVEGQGL